MPINLYMKLAHSLLFCFAFLLCGCYTPIINLQSIGLAKDSQFITDMQLKQNKTNPLVFYKECSRNGSAWLYECQSIGLESIQQAIYLYYPNIILNDIVVSFYPKKSYILFEIYDSKLLLDTP